MSTRAPINRTMGAVEWGLLILLSAIWGGSFFLNRLALDGLPPFSVAWARVGIAAAALLLLVRATGSFDWRPWRAYVVMGAVNNVVPFSLILSGQTQIASGLASILNATTPLWTILIAHAFTADERMTANRLAGVLVGLAGVVVMIGPSLLGGLGLNLVAQLAVVGAAVSYGFAGVYGRRFRGQPPLQIAAGQLCASTLMLAPLALAVDRPWQLALPGWDVWVALAGLGLVCSAYAYTIFFRLLASAGATNLALVTLLVPVVAILLGTTILGESLELRHLGGMALIGGGLAAIDGRPLGWLSHYLRSR